MAENQKTCYKNCSNCAYSNKDEAPMWCRFLDLPVTEKNVCKNFYDLSEHYMYTFIEEAPENGLTKKDILAYAISGFNIAAAIVISIILWFS